MLEKNWKKDKRKQKKWTPRTNKKLRKNEKKETFRWFLHCDNCFCVICSQCISAKLFRKFSSAISARAVRHDTSLMPLNIMKLSQTICMGSAGVSVCANSSISNLSRLNRACLAVFNGVIAASNSLLVSSRSDVIARRFLSISVCFSWFCSVFSQTNFVAGHFREMKMIICSAERWKMKWIFYWSSNLGITLHIALVPKNDSTMHNKSMCMGLFADIHLF